MAKAIAVDQKVKLGRMTTSPGLMSHKRAAISRAVDPLVVNNTFFAQNLFSSQALHFFVNFPSPQILWFSIASLIYSSYLPVKGGTLKLII